MAIVHEAYIINSFGWQTVVATPPIIIQGLTTVCPPFTLVPASSAQSWKEETITKQIQNSSSRVSAEKGNTSL